MIVSELCWLNLFQDCLFPLFVPLNIYNMPIYSLLFKMGNPPYDGFPSERVEGFASLKTTDPPDKHVR